MQLVDAINSSHVFKCSYCGKAINMSWWFNVVTLTESNLCFEVSVCRSCVDTPVCDIIERIKDRKTFWYRKQNGSVRTSILVGGFAATLDQHLEEQLKNGSTC